MADILTRDSATALWQELVRDAEVKAGRVLGEDLESYLVFTLMRHYRDAPLAHRVVALEWLEAMQREGRQQRKDELRDVGDRCLLIAGFYPELAQRRHVPLSYFVEVGRGAYDQLASELRAALADLYAQLARAFAQLVHVLIEVRQLSGQWRGLQPLDRHALALQGEPGAFAGAVVVAGRDGTVN
ncbi:MAG TPA: hypothetical protein VNE58_15125 [Casimicrobiaceae bacterium]|nr:hypothetical protein [Casimicrobiaceae bacterium]